MIISCFYYPVMLGPIPNPEFIICLIMEAIHIVLMFLNGAKGKAEAIAKGMSSITIGAAFLERASQRHPAVIAGELYSAPLPGLETVVSDRAVAAESRVRRSLLARACMHMTGRAGKARGETRDAGTRERRGSGEHCSRC
jgi:hypothetical protein